MFLLFMVSLYVLQGNSSVVLQLHTFLQIFPDCLIQLINYNGIDFNPTSIPIIASKYDVYQSNNIETNSSVIKIIILKDREHHLHFTGSYGDKPSNGREDIIDSKNLFCTAQFFLFPPATETHSNFIFYNQLTGTNMLVIPRNYINFGKYQPEYDLTTTYYFQERPHSTFCILVSSQPVAPVIRESPWVQLFAFLVNENYKHKFQFHADLFVIQVNANGALQQDSILWHLCRYCNWCRPFSPILLPNYEDLQSWYSLQKSIVKYKTSQCSPLWRLLYPSNEIWTNASTGNFLYPNRKYQLYFKVSDMDAKDMKFGVTYLNQALLSSIFGNHTFTNKRLSGPTRPKDIPCVENINIAYSLPALEYTEGPMLNFFLPQEFHPFRFVACGGRLRYSAPLSFESFYACFDNLTWLSILVTYFVILIIVNFLFKLETSPVTISLSSFALLVEQGQRHSSQLPPRRANPHFIIYTCLGLAGILLSNAYKGKNITQLTLPVRSLPYEKLEELIRDNFSLYRNPDRVENLEWSLNLSSPPLLTNQKEEDLLLQTVEMNVSLIETELELCPENKGAAIFESEGQAYTHARWLRNQSHIDYEDVSIGKEVYSGVWRGSKLVNNVDPYIAQRTKRLVESGIIDEWLTFWARRIVLAGWPGSEHWASNEQQMQIIEAKSKKKREWKTSMVLNGGIVSLFVVLGASHAMSISWFLIEVFWQRYHFILSKRI